MTQGSSSSERVAEALRKTPPELDDVARARMERAWLGAVAAGSTGQPARSRRGFSARQFAAGVSLGFAAAAALFLIWRPDSSQPALPTPVAEHVAPVESSPRLERWAADGDAHIAPTHEGSPLTTGAEERARLSLGRTRIELSSGTRLVPERLASDLRLRLERGAVHVEFNPAHPGDESMLVETQAARVEVVGTAFRVVANGDGSTDVSVEHGVVRVTTLPFGQARELRAGESLHIAPRSTRQVEDLALRGPSGPADAGSSAQRPAPSPRQDSRVQAVESSDTAPNEPPSAELPPESAEAGLEVVETAPARAAAPPLDADARFTLATRLSERHRYEEARHELYAIVRRGQPLERARAWSLVADTREREHDWPGAGEAYRRAIEAAPESGFGRTALFALARLRESRLDDRAGARHAYRDYLRGAGQAPLVVQARRALCRLGDLEQCAPGEEPTEAPPAAP